MSYLLTQITYLLFFCIIINHVHGQTKANNNNKNKNKNDPNDNKGNTPFLLQDPYDSMCLGPNGFTMCDESALWILTKRTGKKTYSLVSLMNPASNSIVNTNNGLCLQQKTNYYFFSSDVTSMGSCRNSNSQNWEFEFVDQKHVRLSTKGQCLVRGKKQYKSIASLQSCKKGEFIPLVYHPTAVHENGFFLKSADDLCFDGNKFRSCDTSSTNASKLLWGIGIKYVWGEAQRYFFSFNVQDRSNCIVAQGSNVKKGSCTERGAMKWSLGNGQLSINNGRKCLARKIDDTAAMVNCKTASEFITLEVPSVYTNEQLTAMLQNQVRNSSPIIC